MLVEFAGARAARMGAHCSAVPSVRPSTVLTMDTQSLSVTLLTSGCSQLAEHSPLDSVGAGALLARPFCFTRHRQSQSGTGRARVQLDAWAAARS